VFAAACGPEILYKPSPYIDPVPEALPKNAKPAPPARLERQWNLERIGVTQKMLDSDLLAGNANVRIAVMSTGIDYNHRDLVGQVIVDRAKLQPAAPGDAPGAAGRPGPGRASFAPIAGYDVVDGDGFAFDRHGAGTAVAGILAARHRQEGGVRGLMGEVGLYPIRYINENGQSSAALLVAGLEAAIRFRPDVLFIQNTHVPIGSRRDPDVARLELAGIKQKLRVLAEMKVPIVIGAGDDMAMFGQVVTDQVFLAHDNVIVVTSTNKNDQRAFIANQGYQTVHTAAPGELILTTGLRNSYQTVGGTAVAAAHVAGLLGLAKARLGSRFEVESVIAALLSGEGSDQLPQLATAVRGGNRINVAKFLAAL
jgi:subtilisin family serine protease